MDKTCSQLEFEKDNNRKKYKMKGICNSIIYARKL